jgi:hypothetical protein
MRSSKLSLLLAALFICKMQAITYDEEFWEGFDAEKPYEHGWDLAPDVVNITQLEWWFNMTHHFLWGVERGMYNNDTIILDENCFGHNYAKRINWLVSMVERDPLKHYIQIGSIIYQGYYMVADVCPTDSMLSDVFTYAWNDRLDIWDILNNLKNNWLYMTRAMIDAAIVWWEGIPSGMYEDLDQWHAISR